MTIKVALAGAGAFGIKHLDGIQNIDGVEVVSLISRDLAKTQEVADKYGIKHVTTDLADSLAIKEVDAVILCTPTQMHASQTIACLEAGKHVQVEIPLCDLLADGEKVVALRVHRGQRKLRPDISGAEGPFSHWTIQSFRGGCIATRTLQTSRWVRRANTTPNTTHISSRNRRQNC